MATSFKLSNIKCTNLVNLEGKKGSIDPYVKIDYLGVSKKTEVRDKELNPSYGEVLEFDLSGKALGPEDFLEVTVKDYEKIGSNKLVGKTTISLQPLLSSNTASLSGILNDKNGEPTSGEITFQAEYISPQGNGENSDKSPGDDRQMADGDLGEEEDDPNTMPDWTPIPAGPEGDAMRAQKKTFKRQAVRKHNLPDKPTDFQIRVKIIEGRQIPGMNINPVVRITLAKESKQTNTRKSTNKPFFDQMFFFNFNEKPNELFDKIITFEVLNSKGALSQALLGTFQLDVGTIYYEKDHAIIRKWLLMTAPEENEANEGEEETKGVSAKPGGPTAGYIKITAFILGPGDQIPETTKKSSTDGDEDDIESNLLRPAGAQLRPATFIVKLYHAEDLPQMDTGAFEGLKKLMGKGPQKDRVDPYMKFSFAGKQLQTVVKYSNNHPEFNQELRVGYSFPSMCERLKLQMYDWDRIGNDDIIGTSFISLSAISGTGDGGFLPCFGPCYVNFYGSTREYSDLPDEYDNLNKGYGEGCGYRGRALVEIKTKLGTHTAKPVENIMAQELVRVQPFMRRRKYKLFASFLSANMISESDGMVEFEVSIGNYGNKLDTETDPQSSSTPPTRPAFDGSSFYFLPWQESKPCCVVESHWEDIAFRLEPINYIMRIINNIKQKVNSVELAIKAKAEPAEIATHLISLLDQLIADCKEVFPTFKETQNGVNELDLKVQSGRTCELEALGKEAKELREHATDIFEAMETIDGYLNRLQDLCIEPQNSLPDVVVWMITGGKRVAYRRIPSHEIFFSKKVRGKGMNCARPQNIVLKYPGKKGEENDNNFEIPACLTIIMWLGLEGDQSNWTDNRQMEGEYSVYAETYENQGKPPLLPWTPKVIKRPNFSDSEGKVRLDKDAFMPPNGWKWDNPPDGNWVIDPEVSSKFDVDSGHKDFIQDAFENESRYPMGNWGKSDPQYTDIHGDEIEHRDETALPDGWKWSDEWKVDNNRACDEEGWQYCIDSAEGGWCSVPRSYHLCKRRRWVRNRTLEQDPKTLMKKKKELAKQGEGWEYAPVFGMKYHLKENKLDFVRRRRWRRKMVNLKPGALPMFTINDKDDKMHRIMPRLFLSYDKPHNWQFQAYLYQARGILGLDSEGVSDPYAKVCFLEKSQKTRVIEETLCPDFDETIIFDDMQIYGSPEIFAVNPPYVTVELFDKDKVGKDEFLGRVLTQPLVKLTNSQSPPTKLKWYKIMRGDRECGDLLAAFELLLNEGIDLPLPPPVKENRYIVPNGIRPIMVKTAVEILAWGVRNMKKYQLASCTSPSAEFEIGSHIIHTDVIKNTKRNPNFLNNVFYKEMFLPKEPLYMPPIVIKVRDHRTFGRKPVVGRHVIASVDLDPPPNNKKVSFSGGFDYDAAETKDEVIQIEEKKKKQKKVDTSLDWWSKYFASIGENEKCGSYIEKGYKTIQIYNSELEKEKEFNGFSDFIKSYPLDRGKQDDDEDDNIVGEIKGLFKFYHLPPDNIEADKENRYFNKTKIKEKSRLVDCLVRVYIIRGRSLEAKDPNGKADPYITIELGKQKVSNRENYIANNVNPLFGAYFELKAQLPVTKDLKIRVMDYDFASRNDLIGETTIDLENRYLSNCRATCGLPPEYHTTGPYKWRDAKTPREILDKMCSSKIRWISPSQVLMNGKLYRIEDFETSSPTNPDLGPTDQRLALYILNSEKINGFRMVQEHVESRVLRNPLQPSMNQGQLDMFVDVFPIKDGMPGPPINIAPRAPHDYELRVIIWGTADVPPSETSITGEEMSDLYVKGWVAGNKEEKQKTDVHYRCMEGEGLFNWRMVFPFKYIPEERVMVVEEKENFWSIDKTLKKMPPAFSVQIWDNDLFSSEDFIGTLELDLSKLVRPKKDIGKWLAGSNDFIDLFEAKSVKGWWMMFGAAEDGTVVEKGKIQMSLEVVSKDESIEKPAGKGREEPNCNPKLDEPKRPESSFLWITSPWKTMKHIIWKKYKWYIIIGILLIILLAFIVLLFYYLPGGIIQKMFGEK